MDARLKEFLGKIVLKDVVLHNQPEEAIKSAIKMVEIANGGPLEALQRDEIRQWIIDLLRGQARPN